MKIIDSHLHIGNSLFGHSNNPAKAIARMDSLEIEKAVVIPFKPPHYHLEEANDLVHHYVSRHPARFIGFGRVDPWRDEAAVEEVHRIFDDLKMAGLFIHPWEEVCPLTSPATLNLISAAAPYKKPVMIAGGHVRVSHPRQIEYLADRFPDVTFIATSGGQINICGELMWDAEQMLTGCPNVIMETSGIYRRDFIEQMTQKIGPGRILFGSGDPYYQQDYEIERIKTANLPDENKEMILYHNARKLFHLE